jgi:hypothetical protein
MLARRHGVDLGMLGLRQCSCKGSGPTRVNNLEGPLVKLVVCGATLQLSHRASKLPQCETRTNQCLTVSRLAMHLGLGQKPSYQTSKYFGRSLTSLLDNSTECENMIYCLVVILKRSLPNNPGFVALKIF